MDYQSLRQYLLSKPEALEDFPFGPDAAVFRVQGRMFALLYEKGGTARVNLKCDPQQALELRAVFDAVSGGYHMNKKHWNTVALDGDVPDGELQRQADHSYGLVVKKLPLAQRRFLRSRYDEQALCLHE